MPPKRAKKGVSLPLAGCTVALSGKFPRSQAALEEDITHLGATLAKIVNASTTHLVTTDVDFAKPSAKVKQAKSHDTQIVKLAWLEDCLEQAVKLKEGDYSFDAPATPAATVTTNGKANGSRKRSADEAEDDSQSQPKKKKAATNGSTSQQGAAKPEPKASSSKANGAGDLTNIAKSRDILIPVDENCPLAHYRVYIDQDDVIYDAALNQTNASNNNNKFYRVQVCHTLQLYSVPT
jgi:poly [ADP-ribose] polymerase 2/3/4